MAAERSWSPTATNRERGGWNTVQWVEEDARIVNSQRMWATDLPSGVTEDDGFGDRHCIVQVTEGVEFPFFLLHRNEVLLDTLERQLITSGEDANWIGHKFGRHLQNVGRKRGTQQDNLRGRRETSVDLIDLVLETPVQQLVRFVEYKHLDVPRPKTPLLNHVRNSSGRTEHDVLPILKFMNILANGGTTNTRMTLDVHVVSQSEDDRLDPSPKFSSGGQNERLGLPNSVINRLEDWDRECRGFIDAGLSLGDHVSSLGDWKNRALLECGGFFEVCNTQQKTFITDSGGGRRDPKIQL